MQVKEVLLIAMAGIAISQAKVLKKSSAELADFNANDIVTKLDKEMIQVKAEASKLQSIFTKDIKLRSELVKSQAFPSYKSTKAKQLLFDFLKRNNKHLYRKLESLDVNAPDNFWSKYWKEIATSAGLLGVGAANEIADWVSNFKQSEKLELKLHDKLQQLQDKEKMYGIEKEKLTKAVETLSENFQGMYDKIAQKKLKMN